MAPFAYATALTFLGSAPVAVAASPPETHAASPAPPATAANEAVAHERWYGHQTLLADGAALVLLVAGIAVNDRDDAVKLQLAAGAAYLLGGPVVHWVHRRRLASLGSLGLRVGIPVMGGLLGSALGGLAAYDDGDEVVRGAVFGLLGGFATAITVDATLVAWERVPSAAAAPPPAAFTWRPCLTLTETRTELGVMGSF